MAEFVHRKSSICGSAFRLKKRLPGQRQEVLRLWDRYSLPVPTGSWTEVAAFPELLLRYVHRAAAGDRPVSGDWGLYTSRVATSKSASRC